MHGLSVEVRWMKVPLSHVAGLFLLTAVWSVVGAAQTAREPLSRGQAVQLFLDQNREVEAARFQAERVRADEIGASLRPNPEVTVTAENFPVAGETTFRRLYEVAATYTETIELGGKRQLRRTVASLSADAADARLDSTLRQGIVDVERLYLDAVRERERTNAAEETSSLFQELLGDMEARFEEGAVSRGDLIRVRLETVRTERVAEQAGLALAQAMIRLTERLGESDFGRWMVVDDVNFAASIPDLSTLRQSALADRPDLRAVRAEAARSEQNIVLQRAEGSPDIRPFVGYKRVASSDTVLFGVTLPLNFRDRNQDGVARAIADQGIAESRVSLVENRVLAEVEAAYRVYESARGRVSRFEEGLLEEADETRDIALVSYEEGVAELVTLLDAAEVRAETRNAYFDALFDYGTSILEIERAVGRDLTP